MRMRHTYYQDPAASQRSPRERLVADVQARLRRCFPRAEVAAELADYGNALVVSATRPYRPQFAVRTDGVPVAPDTRFTEVTVRQAGKRMLRALYPRGWATC